MNYNKFIKQTRKIMEKTNTARYWGTLIVIAVTCLLGIVAWHLPELISVLKQTN